MSPALFACCNIPVQKALRTRLIILLMLLLAKMLRTVMTLCQRYEVQSLQPTPSTPDSLRTEVNFGSVYPQYGSGRLIIELICEYNLSKFMLSEIQNQLGASIMFGDTIIYDAQRQITKNLKQ